MPLLYTIRTDSALRIKAKQGSKSIGRDIFEDFGRLASEIRHTLERRLLDTGNKVSSDQSNDLYQLQGHQISYNFGRKVIQDSRRSRHYTCNMADTNQRFVITIADNML